MSNRQSTKQTATAARPTPPEAQDSETVEGEKTPNAGEHVVADGESLDDIAEKTGVPAAHLQRLNAIKCPELIWPGMALRTK